MINYDELWTTHRCLEIKSNKKNQLFKNRVTRINVGNIRGDEMIEEYLVEQFNLKKQHLRIFFTLNRRFTSDFFKDFKSRKHLETIWGISGSDGFQAKYIERIPNAFCLSVYPLSWEMPFDDNIDGKNKYLKPEFFHIKIYRDKKEKHKFRSYYKRTFKKIKNISKDKSKLQFKGISFYDHPTVDKFIILGGAKLSEFTFTQDFGDDFKKLGSELKSDFKKLGSEMKSDMKDIFSSFNIFKKKRK